MSRQARGDIARAVGARLREIREQRRLSLAEVEAQSGGAIGKGSLRAYECGTRAMTLARFAEVCAFYGIELHEVLPTPQLAGHAFAAITAATRNGAREAALVAAYEKQLDALREQIHACNCTRRAS